MLSCSQMSQVSHCLRAQGLRIPHATSLSSVSTSTYATVYLRRCERQVLASKCTTCPYIFIRITLRSDIGRACARVRKHIPPRACPYHYSPALRRSSKYSSSISLKKLCNSMRESSPNYMFMKQRSDDEVEQLETNIYTFENPNATEGSKRVLVTSNDPGSFNALKHIVRSLITSPRCRGITALISGNAAENFKKEFPRFERVREEEIDERGNERVKSVFEDVGDLVEKCHVDVALLSLSTRDGPEVPMLFAGKDVFGARKTFVLVDGWGKLEGPFTRTNTDNMEHIDGIFCNDEFEKTLIESALPAYPPDYIHPYGTPVFEHLELDKAAEYRSETRKKLGIGADAFVVLYVGDVSLDYEGWKGVDSTNINVQTFEKTREAL